MFTLYELNTLLHDRKLTINGDLYTVKDYLYKTEIRKNGKLYAYVDNRKPLDDLKRIEYV